MQNGANDLRGQINFRHTLEGFGPTFSLDAYRPMDRQSGIFGKARGSVLFGDGKSNLAAIEDADLGTPFTTTLNTISDDLLSIAELQVGYRWKGRKVRRQAYTPFLSIAMEGQIWHGAGNASSEDGTLGFYGFTAGGGFNW